jgi:hypothetical protein
MLYFTSDGAGLYEVSYDEYVDAFNAGKPIYSAFDPAAEPVLQVLPEGWQDLGYTTEGLVR